MANANFNETINLLKSGPENLSPDTGIRSINDWLDYLSQHEAEGTAAVRATLKELKQHLSAGGPDSGSSITALLGKLSRETLHVANSDELSNGSSIREIGEALAGR